MQCLRRILTYKKYNNYIKLSRSFINCSWNYGNSTKLVSQPLATRLFDQRFLCSSFFDSCGLKCSYSTVPADEFVDQITFERVCEETLESLTDYFEEIIESDPQLSAADVSYSSGVLTISFGRLHGTYVINKQTPNKQIWLSSPTSGPKRYDLVPSEEYWIYRHSGETLHQLLQNEISQIVTKSEVDFANCSHSRL